MSMRPRIKHEFIIGKVVARKCFLGGELCISPISPQLLASSVYVV